MGSSIQQYCLRWNNHRSNLLLVFEHLFQTEAFTDVTLACEGSSIKAHKMVLAACSSYFQQLFMENECRHPIVILKDIRFSEIKAILEYMYKGEVNVAQDQLAGLLKAAETLKVKGLVENHQNNAGSLTPPHQSPYPPPPNSGSGEYMHPSPSSGSGGDRGDRGDRGSGGGGTYTKANSILSKFIPNDVVYDSPYNDRSSMSGFPIWSTSKLPSLSPSPRQNALNTAVQHQQIGPNGNGLPITTNGGNGGGGGSGGNNIIGNSINNNCSYENSMPNEPVPLKKKKFMNINKDTPILRTVLGHTSLQGLNSTGEPPQQKSINYSMSGTGCNSNGPTEISSEAKALLGDSPDHFMDDSGRSVESDKAHEDNHSFNLDDDKHGIATYVPTQKPEWKRYKQYTRNDIMAAIDAVRAGMSALQAARKYGVPSRTLYDKVKKLGITTNRPYRKGSFPMSPYQGMSVKDEGSGFSPEDHPLELSSGGHGNGNLSGGGGEGDSDKMDSEPGSFHKEDSSPPLIMDTIMKEDSNHVEGHNENGSVGNCTSSSPREHSENERSVSD